MGRKVIVALSGGVDSAVTALLLKRAGEEVEALFMHNWEEDDEGFCTAAEDFQDARRVADDLGIVLHAVDLSREYRDRVFAHFLGEYRAGRTPNPDVLCNREIKFGDCLRHAHRLGAGRLATGHYARLVQGPGGAELHKAVDAGKDQSYFLHDVPRTRFDQALMPLGTLHKEEVREIARQAGLPVHDKRDSTGICFIGERPFRAFLENFVTHSPGPMTTPEGEPLGEHIGLPFYTLGQRSGIGIGGRRDSAGGAWYVVGKDIRSNTLLVGQGEHHPALFTRCVSVTSFNWLYPTPLPQFDAAVKLRYRQTDQPARIAVTGPGNVRIDAEEPQRAVTPGQSAVVYQETLCLGGGVIDRTDI